MKSRKRLWILVGILGLLVIATGYLAWPTDELATVMRLKSFIYRQNKVIDKDDPTDPGQTIFLLRAGPDDFHTIYPSLNLTTGRPIPFPVPPGRTATLTRLGKKGLPSAKEEWTIIVDGDDRPWYQRILARIRGRLGL